MYLYIGVCTIRVLSHKMLNQDLLLSVSTHI